VNVPASGGHCFSSRLFGPGILRVWLIMHRRVVFERYWLSDIYVLRQHVFVTATTLRRLHLLRQCRDILLTAAHERFFAQGGRP
jgi:hypothetical protein